jgi:hypothetical protein
MAKSLILITIKPSDTTDEKTYPVRLITIPNNGEHAGHTVMVSTHDLYEAITTYDEEFLNDKCEQINSQFAGYVEESELLDLPDEDLIEMLDLSPNAN